MADFPRNQNFPKKRDLIVLKRPYNINYLAELLVFVRITINYVIVAVATI